MYKDSDNDILIHTCESRSWYVYDHLIPALLQQGIEPPRLHVYLDRNTTNLNAFLSSLRESTEIHTAATWHLQDDVLPSSTFATTIEKIDEEYSPHIVIAGFASFYCKASPPGFVPARELWYSFPCIRISNALISDFLSWYETDFKNDGNTSHQSWIKKEKFDDSIFKVYIETREKQEKEEKEIENILHGTPWEDNEVSFYNYAPNLVNHVDYLLGGSIVNKARRKNSTSIYWDEKEYLKEWEEKVLKATRERKEKGEL